MIVGTSTIRIKISNVAIVKLSIVFSSYMYLLCAGTQKLKFTCPILAQL